jgi:hypothetical protein
MSQGCYGQLIVWFDTIINKIRLILNTPPVLRLWLHFCKSPSLSPKQLCFFDCWISNGSFLQSSQICSKDYMPLLAEVNRDKSSANILNVMTKSSINSITRYSKSCYSLHILQFQAVHPCLLAECFELCPTQSINRLAKDLKLEHNLPQSESLWGQIWYHSII